MTLFTGLVSTPPKLTLGEELLITGGGEDFLVSFTPFALSLAPSPLILGETFGGF